MLGRPPLTQEQKDELVRKLEPYLKAGLSLRKACFQAQVPKSTIYDYLDSDVEFSDRIKQIEESISLRVSMLLSNHLSAIEKRQNEGEELTHKDLGFLKWFASTSNKTKEEFSKREEISSSFDPEAEIRRVARIINEHISLNASN